MPTISLRRFLAIAAVVSVIVPAIIYLTTALHSRADTSPPGIGGREDIPITRAGRLLMDTQTGLPAVAPMTMNFVRTPDRQGPDGKGRYLIAVNSGFGLRFNSKSKDQQTLSVIDLNLKPDSAVVQNVYFPTPQSANFGLVFDPKVQSDGKYLLYVSGGFQNRIWLMSFDPKALEPLQPSNASDKPFAGPFLDVSGFADSAPSPNYNKYLAAVYPTGIALSPDGSTIYSANDLGDSLGIISDLRDARKISRVALVRPGSTQFTYPYDVKLLTRGTEVSKIFVSLWGDGNIAVVDPRKQDAVRFIEVGRHPTLMQLNRDLSRLFVVNSDADNVSVIDTRAEKVVETINLRLSESAKNGVSPEGLALSDDENTLFVANAHANAVAVVKLEKAPTPQKRSKLLGFIPTGNYASAVACVGNRLFIANGKGTGMENSSERVNDSGLYPNMPNKDFPGENSNKRGIYSVAIVSGNISVVDIPDEKQLYSFTQQSMRNNGLLGNEKHDLFPGGKSPFKHVIYIIRENRTYDQIFGDLQASADGRKADGDSSVAIFGSGDAAR